MIKIKIACIKGSFYKKEGHWNHTGLLLQNIIHHNIVLLILMLCLSACQDALVFFQLSLSILFYRYMKRLIKTQIKKLNQCICWLKHFTEVITLLYSLLKNICHSLFDFYKSPEKNLKNNFLNQHFCLDVGYYINNTNGVRTIPSLYHVNV